MQDLMRLIVCGSVDDGKSSLIGRLLYDTKAIFDDQLEALERFRQNSGQSEVNLANLTDGLRSEREQGITIDVAYRFFNTKKRRFIIADTPGHVQYTRNMVTGASTAELALILIDARKGVIEQTRRHTYIVNKLGIKNLVLCINKIDLVDYSEQIFNQITSEFQNFTKDFNFTTKKIIPISALNGDNIVNRSDKTNWYHGPVLLDYLEDLEILKDVNSKLRFPVQSVIRPQSEQFRDFRGYAGQITSGSMHVGQEVIVLPTGIKSSIKEILVGEENLQEAHEPRSVTIQLNDEIDLGKGFLIVADDTLPSASKELLADICWLAEQTLELRKKYILKSLTANTPVLITEIVSKVDINSLSEKFSNQIKLNDLAKIKLKVANSIIYDDYARDRKLGSFILIDEGTNATVAAGMFQEQKVEFEFSI